MLCFIVGALLSSITLQLDTTVVLGSVERDLTGDGQPELLELIGKGLTLDSLGLTFFIRSAGRDIFRTTLAPITRRTRVAGRFRTLTPSEHRARLDEFDDWLFGPSKFMTPEKFMEWLGESAPRRIAQIPEVIARDRRHQLRADSLKAAGLPPAEIERQLRRSYSVPLDTVTAAARWEEIRKTGVVLFQFSAGGDSITAIGWSVSDQRFYRLLECC